MKNYDLSFHLVGTKITVIKKKWWNIFGKDLLIEEETREMVHLTITSENQPSIQEIKNIHSNDGKIGQFLTLEELESKNQYIKCT